MTTIFDRTHFTPRKKLDRLIALATQAGDLPTLYWYVEAKVPGRMTTTGKPQLQAASWPDVWIPVLAVGPDPEISRHYIEILLEAFRASNSGQGIEFGLGLTAIDQLDGKRCYEWGDACWDCVCVVCGGVFQETTPAVEICDECWRASCCKPHTFEHMKQKGLL
jgi:hypothetical protein